MTHASQTAARQDGRPQFPKLAQFNAVDDSPQALLQEVKRLTDELRRQRSLAEVGWMASHVAHEMHNHLVSLTLQLSMLRRRLGDDRSHGELLEKVQSSVVTLDAMVSDLMQFTTDRQLQPQSLVLSELVAEVLDAVHHRLTSQGIETHLDIPVGLAANGDRDMLRRAILNLVLNALDAMPEGGELVVSAYRGRDQIELEIADSGPGLDREERRQAFQPFFSTKGSGTGLGLSIVERIASAHGGDVTTINCPEGGAAFTLWLPCPAKLQEQAA